MSGQKKERSVEEIVEEKAFVITNPQTNAPIEKVVTTTDVLKILQTERQKREEVVEEIKKWAEDYGVYTDGNLREMGRNDACRQLITNLTQPNKKEECNHRGDGVFLEHCTKCEEPLTPNNPKV